MTKLLITLLVISSSWASITPNISSDLNEREKNILKAVPGTSLSYALKDTRTNENISGHLSTKPAVAASVAKVLTTYFALSMLGPDFKFTTTIRGQGSIKNGVYTGDIYLIGSGDPLLTDSRLQNLILQLDARGIKEVKGNFHYDDTDLINLEKISELGLGDQTYNPGISALNSDFNRITLLKDNKGYTPLLNVASFVVEETKESFSPSQRFMLAGRNPEKWLTSSKIKYGRFEDLPVRDPSLQTAERLRFLSTRHGITLPAPTFKKAPNRLSELALSESAPLWQTAELTLEYSNNLLAETLLLRAVKKIKEVKTLQEAGEEMLKWYKKQFPKIDFEGTQLVNGSGLSTQTIIAPKTLVDFLSKVRLKSFEKVHFASLLNLPEKTSWLKRHLHTPELAYRVWAKTGSLDYVNNISGYIYTKSGKHLSFSLFLSDEEKRLALDGDDNKKLKDLRDDSRKWKEQTNQVIYELLYSWYERY